MQTGGIKMDFNILFERRGRENPGSGAFLELVRDRPAAFAR